MSTVMVNGIDVAYIEQGQGEPVVFVHGGTGDYRVWDQQLGAFAATHRAIALSCRGSWPNAKLPPGEPLTLDTHVEDLALAIRALSPEPVHLVGHSSPGGFGGLLLAVRHPELLRSLALLEPPVFPLLGVNIPPRPPDLAKLALRHPRAAVGLVKFGVRGMRPAMAAFDRGDDAEGLRVFMAANAGAAAVDQIPDALFERFLDNVGPLKAQIRAGFPAVGADEVRSIRVPTLLVSGAESPAHLTAVVDRLATLLPQVDRLSIAGATHNMFFSHPAEFNAGVLAFLKTR